VAQQTIADPSEGCDPQGMTFPLLAADQTWALWAMLLCAGAFGLWAETTPWGRRLSGAVIAIGTTFVLSNLGVIPSDAPTYDAVWSYVVPLAIPLLLLRADVRRIVREAGPTLGVYLIGAAGTVLGTIFAFQVVDLGPDGAKIAGIFCATYVGGSMNYVAAARFPRTCRRFEGPPAPGPCSCRYSSPRSARARTSAWCSAWGRSCSSSLP
jgi:hypothetical protein